MPDPNMLEKMTKLPDEARLRVESALKTALERELASGVMKPSGEAAAFDKQSHDRGPLFGKDSFDKQNDSSRHLEDMRILSSMDESAFKSFTERLRAVREAGGQR